MNNLKVIVYFQDRDTNNTKGFEECFRDYKDLNRYLRERNKWTVFRTLVLIKGEQIENKDKEVD